MLDEHVESFMRSTGEDLHVERRRKASDLLVTSRDLDLSVEHDVRAKATLGAPGEVATGSVG